MYLFCARSEDLSALLSKIANPKTPIVKITTPAISIKLNSLGKKTNNKIAVTAPEEFWTGAAIESSIYLKPIKPIVIEIIYKADTGKYRIISNGSKAIPLMSMYDTA